RADFRDRNPQRGTRKHGRPEAHHGGREHHINQLVLNPEELKEFLDHKVVQYSTSDFIASDPVSIPHNFSEKEDIEIAGFLTAIISWGNRKSILKNAGTMMELLDNSPYDFVMNHSSEDLNSLRQFVHRTFNGTDLVYFITSLQNIYRHQGGLEALFTENAEPLSLQTAIHEFKKVFFELPHEIRTEKHVSDPMKNSAAKRINMFLRWMVRKDSVDFGIWKD